MVIALGQACVIDVARDTRFHGYWLQWSKLIGRSRQGKSLVNVDSIDINFAMLWRDLVK